MEAKNIKNVINRLIASNETAILISGPWGIGKTYEIKEYIKSKAQDVKDKKLKIAYSSLFGKNSIDEVNTELYQLIHPAKKVLNTITNVAKLINIGVGFSCGINLNIDDENLKPCEKLKSKKNIPYLIILDDFERKSDKITAEELLGFINNLINQGFKVVVLADLDTKYGKKNKKYEIEKLENDKVTTEKYISKINLSDDILGFYKEKIFDRIYKITETPEDVIRTIFAENINLIADKLMIEFNKNIRMAIKANSLFLQIQDYIKSNSYNCNKFEQIMKICIYCVNELMTNKYSIIYSDKCKESDYLKYCEKSFGNIITSYDKSLRDYFNLVEAINDIYLNEDYSLLDEIFNPNDENILKSCFFCSDENKINIIKKQYELILSIPDDLNYNHSTINQLIRDWYCYADYVDLSFIDKEELFKKLNKLNFRLDSFGEQNETFINLIKEYKEFCNNQIKYSLTSKLVLNDLKELKSGLYEITNKYNNLDDESKEYIKSNLKENNFFLQKIDGDINDEFWGINHLICQIIKEYIPDLKNDLLNLLNGIKRKYPNDKSCEYRVNSLIKQYDLDMKKEEV